MNAETNDISHEYQPTYFFEKSVEALRLFQKEFVPRADTVYYPCCLTDLSVIRGFPNSRVIHVEINERAVQSLQRENVEVYHDNALHYRTPVPADVLIMLNPMILPERPAMNVRVGGYVLCNSWHSTDIQMHRNPEFTLVGAVHEIRNSNKLILRMGSDKQYFFDETITYAQHIAELGTIGRLEEEAEREQNPSWQPPATVEVTRRKKGNVFMYIFQRIHENEISEQALIKRDWEEAIEHDRDLEKWRHPNDISFEDLKMNNDGIIFEL